MESWKRLGSEHRRSLLRALRWVRGPLAGKCGVATATSGSLCRGLLTGSITHTTKFKADDLRRNDPKFQEPRFSQYLAAVASLEHYARERYGKPVAALAVRWLLDQGDTIVLWGARRPAQLDPAAGPRLPRSAVTRRPAPHTREQAASPTILATLFQNLLPD